MSTKLFESPKPRLTFGEWAHMANGRLEMDGPDVFLDILVILDM